MIKPAIECTLSRCQSHFSLSSKKQCQRHNLCLHLIEDLSTFSKINEVTLLRWIADKTETSSVSFQPERLHLSSGCLITMNTDVHQGTSGNGFCSEFHSTPTPKKQLRFSANSFPSDSSVTSISSSPHPPHMTPHQTPHLHHPPPHQSIRRWSPKYSREHRYLSSSTSTSFMQLQSTTAAASASSSSPNDLDSLYFFLGNVYAGVSVKCSQNTSAHH
jgi:hypothetical protein